MTTRTDAEIEINKVAQGLQSMESGLAWFKNQTATEQLNILRYTVAMISQAHPREHEVKLAMDTCRLKTTYTPLVILALGNLSLPARLSKILTLPEDEYFKSFQLLTKLLAISDGRRKATECAGGCSHWWHKDLSSKEVIQKLLTDASG